MDTADSAARLIKSSQVSGCHEEGDTWHLALACGDVCRGLKLITDHLHSEQTHRHHNNIYTAHHGWAMGVLIRLIIEAVLSVRLSVVAVVLWYDGDSGVAPHSTGSQPTTSQGSTAPPV